MEELHITDYQVSAAELRAWLDTVPKEAVVTVLLSDFDDASNPAGASDVLKESVPSVDAAAHADMGLLMELALVNSMLIERMMTLAMEYGEKAITPERFAARVYAMLDEHDQDFRKRFEHEAALTK
jgi:hypothetical protein